jgi:hypothetical protein
VAWLVLGLLMALSAVFIWSWSTHATLHGDEWGYANRTSVLPTTEYLFNPPPTKHLIAIPLLLYKAAFEGFGISSYVPYRLAHIALLLLCAGLFYALVRPRVGDALAVLPTAILLFLGSEVVATPLRIPSLIATAAGLAMLLALERRDLKGDVAAFCLLALSLASHSTSFAFAAAAAVLVLSRPAPERWRRAWVFALPILAYATWWVLEFDAGPSQSLGSAIVGAPVYIGKSLAVTLRAISGVSADSSYLGLAIPSPLQLALGAVLLAMIGAVLVASVRRSRAISPFALAITAALVTFWIATNFAPGPERAPQESRYLYPDALLFLLLLCELGRDFQLPRTLTTQLAIVILALFAISIAGNLYELRNQVRVFDNGSDRLRAGLTGLALAGSSVPPQFSLANALFGGSGLPAFALRRELADYGSPAYSPAEVLSRPQPVRVVADDVLLRAGGSELQPRGSLPASQNPAPRDLLAFGGKWTTASRGCIELRPSDAAARGVLSLPAGRRLGLAANAGPPVIVRAGLFAEDAAIPIGFLQGGGRAVLDLPATAGVLERWQVAIQAQQRVLACSVS